ncbi:hypothetical protein [Arthrobacter sp. JCM 19049]|uniref:hypothetical protein n=1 Tax=Arthrobacter sp. JCM 19049 TaxID=1460643 RepID=UPI002436FBBF|nr:hypothetical protein [Arthrobacter sp. JCM 19049]
MDNARAAEHRVVTLLALLSSPRTITEFVGEWWSTRGSPPRDSTERMLELLGVLLRAPLDPFNQPDPHQRQVDEFLEDLTRVLDGNQQLPVQSIRIRHSEALPPWNWTGAWRATTGCRPRCCARSHGSSSARPCRMVRKPSW